MKKLLLSSFIMAAVLFAGCSKDKEPVAKQMVGTYVLTADTQFSCPSLGDAANLSQQVTDTVTVANPDGSNITLSFRHADNLRNITVKGSVSDDGTVHFDPIGFNWTIGTVLVTEKSTTIKYDNGTVAGSAQADIVLKAPGIEVPGTGSATVKAHKI